MKPSSIPIRQSQVSVAVSLALSLMAFPIAQAQETLPGPQAQSTQAPQATAADAPTQVVVRGIRQAEQTSIDSKKNARTAQDSIVADDIGSFPDRNVAEAISRISGIALDRSDFGEGNTVTVRGNTPDLTRVEIDGMSALNAGGTDQNGGGEGRGVSLMDLPAELIQSVDVVKGSTADMTEGSLGGSIIIKTRTGLDFKKRTIVASAAAEQNTLNKKWTPRANFIFADKFLDSRVGVVVNLSKQKLKSEAHGLQQNQGNSYERALDFDHSPEKTFSFNPSVIDLGNPASTTAREYARSAASGGGFLRTFTPQEILQRAAAANSKAECATQFPLFSAADLAPLSNANRQNAQNTRLLELRTCLNQWNDYTPYLVRNSIRRQDDDRSSGDIRVDFKVNKELTVYAKHNRNTRITTDDQWFLQQGAPSFNASGSFVDSTGSNPQTSPYVTRTPVAGSGYYFYDTPINASTSSTYRGFTNGQVANIVPGSVKVDASHHVTEFVLSNGSSNTDQLLQEIDNKTRTSVAGGTWRSGDFRAEFLLGDTKSEFNRINRRAAFGYSYGPVRFTLADSGLWGISPEPGTVYNQADPNNYAQLVSTGAGMPLKGPVGSGSAVSGTSLAIDPQHRETTERTFKLDMTYNVGHRIPFIGNVKFGGNGRKYDSSSWGAGGLNIETAANGTGNPLWRIAIPDGSVRSFMQACEDTAASRGTVNSCKFGISPAPTAVSATDGRNTRDTIVTLTQQQYRDILGQAMTIQSAPFFNGASGRPDTLIPGWTAVDVNKLYDLVGLPNTNVMDCIKRCMGNDGQMYDQPLTRASEKVVAGYLSTDFEIDRIPFTSQPLPWGMELNGNFGWRYVRTNVKGTSSTTFQVINEAGRSEIRRNTTLDRSTTDIMPILNLAWWPVKDSVVVRFNRAKTVARPPVSRLVGSSVVCTYDELQTEGAGGEDEEGLPDMNCSGTLGNPGLRPFTNINRNLSLEWYPNRDTVLSAAVFSQKGRIGAGQVVSIPNARPFAGTGMVDASGRSLEDVEFTIRTWENRQATSSEGIEIGGKTAFTFLPSFLRHTGVNANITKIRGKVEGVQYLDLITGTPLDPIGQQDKSWNASLWYDDGALSARVALQVTDQFFRRIADDDNLASFPAPNLAGNSLPYNPGAPLFRDARRFIDVRIGYKFKNGLEVFAEGRNIGKSTVTNSAGAFQPFSNGIPTISDYTYSGAKYLVGMTLRY